MNNASNHHKVIGQWLMLGVFMLVIQIMLGGITRLTGSGLSITEWKLLLGALPPMNETDWQLAFEKYQQIGQFKYINADFTLSDFKFIYFWEWLHRDWGRFIGIVFVIPFIYFLIKRMIPKSFIPKLIILFLLGMSQGLIGWIMVASGLNDTNLYVDHFKLSLHFISALFLISLTFWYALEYIYPNGFGLDVSKRSRQFLIVIIVILGIQLTYGAFMAGLKGAQAASTWPSINGDWLPPSVLSDSIFNNKISVHFIHRNLGYLLALGILLWTIKARKRIKLRAIYLPLMIVLVQVILGVSTIIYSPKAIKNGWGIFEWNAQLHQLVAMCLLLSLVYILYLLRLKPNNRP